MTKKEHQLLTELFEYQHNNPPKGFNESYDPNHKQKWACVIRSMEDDGFYENHTREECSLELHKRLGEFESNGTHPNIGSLN